MTTINEKYAKVLTQYSMSVRKGDKMLIIGSYLAQDLVREVYKQAIIAGAHPEIKLSIPGTEKIFYDHATDEQLKYISPTQNLYYNEYDCLLSIDSPFNLKELQNIPPEKKQLVSIAKAELNKVFMKRSAEGKLRWTLCVHPTDSAAQEAGMSTTEYAEFVYSACFLNDQDPVKSWKELAKKQQAVVDRLNKAEIIAYKSDDVDITFSSKGRKWINSCGTFNMPCGEVFTTPLEDSINGKVRFSYPGIFMGQEIEDITLEVKDGEVVSWDAKKGKPLLDKVFEIEGARRFGEAAIGTNKGIDKFTKNMLFDEKMGGTIHLAIGAAYPETGGKNESSIHWDLLADMTKNGYIKADGEVIYKNGEFLITG